MKQIGAWFIPLLIAAGVMSLVCFAAFGLDKRRARKGRWRIMESTLFFLSACLGAWGGLCGMKVFRHKTQKPAFRIVIPLLALLQAGLLVWAGLSR